MKRSMMLLICIPCITFADTLEFKNGTLLEGVYMGGTAGSIRFETTEGLQVVSKSEVVALTFTSPVESAAVQPEVAPSIPAVPAAALPTTPVTVPAGTLLTVKLEDTVDSRTAAGRKFGATLVADLLVNEVVAVKAGTPVLGEAAQSKQGGRLAGKSALVITLTGMNVGGKLIPIMTTNYGEEGTNALKKTARNAAIGAIIGEATNNDAGGGAAIGLGTAALSRGGSVTIPAGTTLEFELNAPLDVPALAK